MLTVATSSAISHMHVVATILMINHHSLRKKEFMIISNITQHAVKTLPVNRALGFFSSDPSDLAVSLLELPFFV
jgi:hypothetical protein